MAIAIRKNKNSLKALEEVLKELNFKPGKRIFIKPNLSGRDPVLPGENTSVEVMDALIELLKREGAEITIGHGQLLGNSDYQTSFEETIEWSGFDKYKKMEGVELVNLDDLEREETEAGEMNFHLPIKFFASFDAYINLAKIKTHMEATVSFSLKNQMGLLSPMDRVMIHKTDLEKRIAELALSVKPNLSILEGFPAMDDNGPHHGKPNQIDLIAAGSDMVELDSFVSEILGYDSKKIRHIRLASEIGAGNYFNFDKLNDYKNYFVRNFRKAKNVYRFGRKLFAYPTYSCSRCINAVNLAGREFKKHPFKYWRIILKSLFSKNNVYVVFGKADNLKLPKVGKFVCIGSCAKNFAKKNNSDCLDKCPPGIDETREFLVKKISNNNK